MRCPVVALRASKQLAFMAAGAALVLVWGIAIFGQDTARSRTDNQAGSAYRGYRARSRRPRNGWKPMLRSMSPSSSPHRRANATRRRCTSTLSLNSAARWNHASPRDPARSPASSRPGSIRALKEVAQLLRSDPNSVPIAKVDEVTKLYDSGFRKLAEAQRRERCVFETGIGAWPQTPHVQESRMVAWIASLRVQRAVQRGDFDAAVDDVKTVLRLAHDLQLRGDMVSDLVAAAILRVVCGNMVTAILGSPGLRAEHCDRLLKGLAAE